MPVIPFVKMWANWRAHIDALDETERGRLFTAVLDYVNTGETPILNGNEKFLFPVFKDSVDKDVANYKNTSQKRSEAGKQGGRPQKQKKQMLSEKTFVSPKSICDKIEERGKTIEDISPPSNPPQGDGDGQSAISALIDDAQLSDTVKAKLREWLAYKGKNAYKLAGAKALVSRTCKNVTAHGDAAVCDLIDDCMGNGYKGIIWEKLDRMKGGTSASEIVINSSDKLLKERLGF